MTGDIVQAAFIVVYLKGYKYWKTSALEKRNRDKWSAHAGSPLKICTPERKHLLSMNCIFPKFDWSILYAYTSINLPQLSIIYIKTSFLGLEPSRNPGVITDFTLSIQMITGHPLIISIQMNHILEAQHLFWKLRFVCVWKNNLPIRRENFFW